MHQGTVQGGCFCGKVRYKFSPGEYPVANCHCTMRRRVSAAPFVTWVVVPVAEFAYTQGAPKRLDSSDKGTRYFCSDCGTPLTCIIHQHPDNVDITTGSLDNPAAFVPTIAVHSDTKLPWLHQTEQAG